MDQIREEKSFYNWQPQKVRTPPKLMFETKDPFGTTCSFPHACIWHTVYVAASFCVCVCEWESVSVYWEGPLVKRICIPNWIWSSLRARRGDLAAQRVIIAADGQINCAPKLSALHTGRECPSGAPALLHTRTDGCHKETWQIRAR